jgi:hypothetical protein
VFLGNGGNDALNVIGRDIADRLAADNWVDVFVQPAAGDLLGRFIEGKSGTASTYRTSLDSLKSRST